MRIRLGTAPYSFIFLDALLSVCEGTDVRVFENKIYGAKMERKLDGKQLGSVRFASGRSRVRSPQSPQNSLEKSFIRKLPKIAAANPQAGLVLLQQDMHHVLGEYLLMFSCIFT